MCVRAWVAAMGAVGMLGCEDGVGQPSGAPHPCVGHRTDTVWDDGSDVWVGCGSTTEGTGLYRSTDGGRTWSAVDGFDGMRVSQVVRAGDGLFAAGQDGSNGDRVVGIDGGARGDTVFASSGQLWNSFHVGTYVRTPEGLEIAESLTGAGIAVRDGGEWSDGSGWWPGETSYQILDAAVSDARVVAVGSTIVEPPTVFVQGPGPGFTATPVELATHRGELWSVDADGRALAAGGVDQDADVGTIFTTDGDPSDPSAWIATRLDTLDCPGCADDATWVRAVCRSGDRVIAAGELTVRSDGLLLESLDGGLTWSDRTPDGAPSLTACHLTADRLVVAGAQGWFGAF